MQRLSISLSIAPLLGLLVATAPNAYAQDSSEPAIPGAPVVQPEAESRGVAIEYDKGLEITGDNGAYQLKLGIRNQLRAQLTRTEAAGELEVAFLIPRLRLQFSGYAFGEANGYKIEYDVSSSGSPSLKDAFYERTFSPALRLRVGQWKRPFSRQQLVSDFGSEFLERAITDRFAGAGRDLGLAVHNNYEKSPDGLEWAFGVFNSTGERGQQTLDCDDPTDVSTCVPSRPSNVPDDFGPELVARVGWNYGGIKGYSEGDLEGGPLRVAVAASYQNNLRDLDEDAAGDLQMEQAAEADFILKAYGYDLSGAVYWVKDGVGDALLGFYAQGGAFVVPETVQLAARFATHELDADDGSRRELLGAINWYFSGHAFKWMLDGGILQTVDDETETDVQVRTQLQFVF